MSSSLATAPVHPLAPPNGASAPVANAPWLIFAVASVAVFLVSIDSTVLYAAFGSLRAAFPEARAADLSWVLNAYTVVFAALLAPAGRLADLYGRKRIFADRRQRVPDRLAAVRPLAERAPADRARASCRPSARRC